MEDEQAKWETLREDLELLPGPSYKSGAPSWTLSDPSAGKFYRIGWLEFEILKRWHYSDPQQIIQDIKQTTLLRPAPEDLISTYQFLKSSFLLNTKTKDATQNMLAIKELKEKGSLFHKLLKNYLFFRIPLVRPDMALDKLKPLGRFLFRKPVYKFILFIALLGIFLVFRDFDSFLNSFKILQNPAGLIAGFFVLAFAKIIHELGHAMTCKHYGCRVPAMGVAFIVLWPLLWTDTTEAWRLTDKYKRLVIDSAGIMSELALAAFASILWAVLPEGMLKDATHLLAGITWLMTLLVNLNPFMRFDGYYLLSDMLDIPNVQERSFALAKNRIRYSLWGMVEKSPEQFSPRLEISLIFYAFGTWVYRFFLFLGIALLVYHFFFKALGAFLMAVELWWFIARPVIKEMQYWLENRKEINMSFHRKTIFTIITVVLFILLVVPWKGTISATAILKSTQEIPLIAGQASYVTKINADSGQKVVKDQILFVFEHPDLSYQLKQTIQKKKILEKKLKDMSVEEQYYYQAIITQKELQKLIAEITLKKAEQKMLVISAPIDGVLVDVSDALIHSKWVAKGEYLGLVLSEENQIEAFVKESDLALLEIGAKASFYDSSGRKKSFHATVVDINTNHAKIIPYPELGSNYGGRIIMHVNANGDNVPAQTYYKIILKTAEKIEITQTIAGVTKISSKPRSILTNIYRKIISILIQESGL